MMFSRKTDSSLGIVGVALEGRDGTPVVVLESPDSGRFLPLSVDTFDAEILIRDFLDDQPETTDSAAAWLADLLRKTPPRMARVDFFDNGSPAVRLQFGLSPAAGDRLLPPGEGLVLCRRLNLPVSASEELYEATREDLKWMGSNGTFTGDFLYLSPPQYAPGIPVE